MKQDENNTSCIVRTYIIQFFMQILFCQSRPVCQIALQRVIYDKGQVGIVMGICTDESCNRLQLYKLGHTHGEVPPGDLSLQ
jgi:hypothetical protein